LLKGRKVPISQRSFRNIPKYFLNGITPPYFSLHTGLVLVQLDWILRGKVLSDYLSKLEIPDRSLGPEGVCIGTLVSSPHSVSFG